MNIQETDQKENFIYKIMMSFAKKQDNHHDYRQLHYKFAFWAVFLLVVVTLLAANADYKVLFAIFSSNGRNFTEAMIFAASSTAVIQILILGAGGLLFKMSLNGKHPLAYLKARKGNNFDRIWLELLKENVLLWTVYLILFVAGFSTTIHLSFRTDERAAAEARSEIEQTNNLLATLPAAQRQQLQEDLNKLQQQYKVDSTTIANQYNLKIEAAASKWLVSIDKWNKRLAAKLVTKKKYLEAIPHLESQMAKYTAGPKAEKAEELEQLNKQYRADRAAAVAKHDGNNKKEAKAAANASALLHKRVDRAGRSYQGMNLAFNFVSVVISILLLLFARGANKQELASKKSWRTTGGPSPLEGLASVSRVVNHNLRTQANKRIQERQMEAEREQAKAAKAAAEAAKMELERERKQAANKAAIAERERKQAEQERREAEERRKQLEEERRQIREQRKQLNEELQVVAQRRERAERERKQAEQERKQAEQRRKQIEQERKQAEQERREAEQQLAAERAKSQIEDLVEHNGKMYDRRNIKTYINTYSKRMEKALAEGKADVFNRNSEKLQYWKGKLKELDNE